MNWDYTGTKSYVDVIPPTPLFSPSPAYGRPPVWSTSQAEAGLKSGFLRHPYSTDHFGSNIQVAAPLPEHFGNTSSGVVLPSQRAPLLRTTSLPPVEPSKQLASTPTLPQGGHSPASLQSTPAVAQAIFTPPNSATTPASSINTIPTNTTMADPRKMSGSQRPLMPPPETPSRVMQASPNLFPSLQFSPDLFSAHNLGPATAPAYPQQRLFWDQGNPMPDNHPADSFQTPYSDNFDASFHSSSTVVPNYSPVITQEPMYDLPQQTPTAGPFLDTTAFPMPFQTSPRPPPPAVENPTQFLSSPARRFGGGETSNSSIFRRATRDVPAYHHQIEQSRREQELERKRNKVAEKRADADLIMSSVRRALSPSKSSRPGLKRSQTHSGVAAQASYLRRASKSSFNDSASASSAASAESARNGRSSPLKSMRKKSSSAISKSRASHKSRTAISLAIDENGVAKTVLKELPESENEMDIDEESQSVISSDDDADMHILRSQANSFAVDDAGMVSGPFPASLGGSGRQTGVGRSVVTSRMPQNPYGGLASSNTGGLNAAQKRASMQFDTRGTASVGKGDAQKALRAIIEDRSRSTSTQGEHSSSRQSDSSVQFHSSPPIQQSVYGDFNASPTTVTDPDLATPSTDQESYGSLGATRCVCNSSSPDGLPMIQCDACSKWLHASCVGMDKRQTNGTYICGFCEQTPMRHLSNKGSARSSTRGTGNSASPLAHKSTHSHRGR